MFRSDELSGHRGRGEHLIRPAHVGGHHTGPIIAGQEELAVGHGHLVVVHVHHAARWVGRLRDLVHVADGGDAGTEIEELGEALLDHVRYGAAQERSVRSGDLPGVSPA